MKEDLLHKWLNNELSEAELEAFSQSNEYAAYGKIANVAAHAKSTIYNKEKALERIQNRISFRLEEERLQKIRINVVFLRLCFQCTTTVIAYFDLDALSKHFSCLKRQRTGQRIPANEQIDLRSFEFPGQANDLKPLQ